MKWAIGKPGQRVRVYFDAAIEAEALAQLREGEAAAPISEDDFLAALAAEAEMMP